MRKNNEKKKCEKYWKASKNNEKQWKSKETQRIPHNENRNCPKALRHRPHNQEKASVLEARVGQLDVEMGTTFKKTLNAKGNIRREIWAEAQETEAK